MSLSDFFKYDAGLSASVVTCEDAHDLVKYLRLTEKHWHEFQEHADLSWGRSWLFRGQAMESWSVLAPAWRPEGISFLNKTVIGNTAPSANEFDPPVQEHWDALVAKYGESLSVSRLRELLTQAFFERRVIRQFLERADLLGLPVPIMSTSSTDTYDFGVEYIAS
ncbi:MAG: hypothetical protein IPK52_20690 [Chloroflexi bacterium]|nr:hypothetical protein [Chloroflexota bacterium]